MPVATELGNNPRPVLDLDAAFIVEHRRIDVHRDLIASAAGPFAR
jgi:hypothetical protein